MTDLAPISVACFVSLSLNHQQMEVAPKNKYMSRAQKQWSMSKSMDYMLGKLAVDFCFD